MRGSELLTARARASRDIHRVAGRGSKFGELGFYSIKYATFVFTKENISAKFLKHSIVRKPDSFERLSVR